MRMRSMLAIVIVVGCGDPPMEVDGRTQPLVSPYIVAVSPTSVIAGQHLGGAGEEPFVVEIKILTTLRGGGLPAGDIHDGTTDDRSIVQIELPVSPFGGSDEDTSDGFGEMDEPVFCPVGALICPQRGANGYWRAWQIRGGSVLREVQLARTAWDQMVPTMPVRRIVGVWLRSWEYLLPGDRVLFEYVGEMPRRATGWLDAPLRLHARVRSYDAACPATNPACWFVMPDEWVQPLEITPLPWPSFVRVLAPLDVAAGEIFPLAVVVTDFYGNPYPFTGWVHLGGSFTTDIWFQAEFRREVSAVLPAPGLHRIAPSIAGVDLREVPQWTAVWDGQPPAHRLAGDTHIHTGDGGAQRKFLATFAPGDHAGLYTRTEDALRYLELVAGADFGAVSEHAVRQDGYTLPGLVVADPAFQPGGACVGATTTIGGLDNWWPLAQQAGHAYDGGETGRFISFPAYEWHTAQSAPNAASLIHRVVFFRDFDAEDALPILPGDVSNLPPQCLIRFLDLAGAGPDEAIVVPHMMLAFDGNVDWDLTYADTGTGAALASHAEVEAYQRVGEIFSARNYDQYRPAGVARLTAFEGSDVDPAAWSYRYAWRNAAVHIGAIGSSDNHSQTPGVNDDRTAGGAEYHHHGPGGTAIVLAATVDRDGVYEALHDRASYATSGVRAWLDFRVAGAVMGSEIASAEPQLTAGIGLMVGMVITRLELWGARVGGGEPYQLLLGEYPLAEVALREVTLANPVAAGGDDEEWVYYTRAFLDPLGDVDMHPDDGVWSSPIWVVWSAP